MANYPKELTDLLQQYMTDGNITEKERSVLLRKAESLGVDKDEFDLFIVAEEQKFDQKIDAAKRQAKGKLCPFCEASVPMFTDKCPECGGNITPEATKELEEIIENLEEALIDLKSGKDIAKSKAVVERYVRKANMYYGNNTKIKKLLEEIEFEKSKAQSDAKKIIRRKALTNILTYNKKLTAIVVVVLIVFIWVGITRVRIYAQYLTLTAKIENLGVPDASNYKDIQRELNALDWVKIKFLSGDYNREMWYKYYAAKQKKESEIEAVKDKINASKIDEQYDMLMAKLGALGELNDSNRDSFEKKLKMIVWVDIDDSNYHEEKKKAFLKSINVIKDEVYSERITEQYDKLMAELSALDVPTRSNYKAVQGKLLKIHWVDIADCNYNTKMKDDYLSSKRAIAETIYKIYEELGQEDNAPNPIRWESLYIDN